jgi:hypothetical protein
MENGAWATGYAGVSRYWGVGRVPLAFISGICFYYQVDIIYHAAFFNSEGIPTRYRLEFNWSRGQGPANPDASARLT